MFSREEKKNVGKILETKNKRIWEIPIIIGNKKKEKRVSKGEQNSPVALEVENGSKDTTV